MPIHKSAVKTLILSLLAGVPVTVSAADTGQSLTTPGGHTGPVAAHAGQPDTHAILAARGGAGDSDGDSHPDFADNCRNVANANQRDTDSDGFGNICDPDLDNDGAVNFNDLQLMKNAMFSTPGQPNWNPHADLNGDNGVNFADLQIVKNAFFGAPGPSGMSCAGTVPCPDPVFLFDWPMPGVDADDWVINNYVDLNPGPGILDYMGGAKSYDGHQGVDVDVPTFREMDSDFPIYAVAQGKVLALEESNFDRNVTCAGAGPWNFVTLGHPNGWRTIYGHLKMNSVVVNVGDIVEAGDTLGVVGSSGCSTAPHLHLETLDPGGNVVSPFLNGMWNAPPVYDTPFGFMDATLYNQLITDIDMIKDPPPNVDIVPAGTIFGIGLSMAGGATGDTIELRIVKGATLVASTDIVFNQVFRHSYWIWNYAVPTGASGAHQLKIQLNGTLVRTYDIYFGPIINGFWQVRHGVPSSAYQQLFNDFVANGYRAIWVDGYDVNGATFFNVIFNQSAVASWAAAHGQDNTQFQNFFDAQVAAGRRMIHVDSYLQGGQMRHASIFAQQAGTQWAAYHSATAASHQALFNSLVSQGFRAAVISSVQVAGVQRFTALYNKDAVGSWVALANLSSAQYQTEFNNQTAAGRELAYLNGYTLNGSPAFSAIWIANGPSSWVARHDLNSAQFQNEFDTWTGAGFTTRFITGYERNNVANFGAFWSN